MHSDAAAIYNNLVRIYFGVLYVCLQTAFDAGIVSVGTPDSVDNQYDTYDVPWPGVLRCPIKEVEQQ